MEGRLLGKEVRLGADHGIPGTFPSHHLLKSTGKLRLLHETAGPWDLLHPLIRQLA